MKRNLEALVLIFLVALSCSAAAQRYGYPDDETVYEPQVASTETVTAPVYTAGQKVTYWIDGTSYDWEAVARPDEHQWQDTIPDRYLYSYKDDGWRYDNGNPYKIDKYNISTHDGYIHYYKNQDTVKWKYYPYLIGKLAFSYKTYYYLDPKTNTWIYWTYRAYRPDYIETYAWKSTYSPEQIKFSWIDFSGKTIAIYHP